MTEDSLTRHQILHASEQMLRVLDLLERFSQLDFAIAVRMITVGVWDAKTQRGMLDNLFDAREKGVPSPADIPNLEKELRVAIPASFHMMDKVGGTSAIGSMIFTSDDGIPSWHVFNPAILSANFREGQFGRISGPPRMGKTNIGCCIMEQWHSGGGVAISNILPVGPEERYLYAKNARDLFQVIASLNPKDKWLFVLDEGGTSGFSKQDQASRRMKSLDRFIKIIGKLHGNLLFIEHRPESVPQILQDFATSLFYAHRPELVTIELRGPFMPLPATKIKGFPKTSIPFDTYDVAFFSLNVNVMGLLSAISGVKDPKSAMAGYIRSKDSLAEDEE